MVDCGYAACDGLMDVMELQVCRRGKYNMSTYSTRYLKRNGNKVTQVQCTYVQKSR